MRVTLAAASASALSPQLLVLQGEALDVRHGQLQMLGQVLLLAAECVVVAFELFEPADRRRVGRRGLGGPLLTQFCGEVREVPAERGVGQPEVAGDRERGRWFAGGLGESLMAMRTSSKPGSAVRAVR